MNYEADRAMNQKRLRMEGEPGHGVVQGNGLPLNYMDNGHGAVGSVGGVGGVGGVGAVGYGGYGGYYGEWGGYGGYAPPAHQNYPPPFHHHQPPNLHMQPHMVQPSYDVGKTGWGQVPLVDMKPKEIKLEPQDTHKRTHPEIEAQSGELDQPKIKIKTDIFKPDDPIHRPEEKQHIPQVPDPVQIQMEPPNKDVLPIASVVPEAVVQPPGIPGVPEVTVPEVPTSSAEVPLVPQTVPVTDNVDKDVKQESPSLEKLPVITSPVKTPMSGLEPKKRGRPKGSTNKPKPPPSLSAPAAPTAPHLPRGPPAPHAPHAPHAPRAAQGRPRGVGYQYAVRPFRRDFSGITFRRRWSDECLDSSHIPNEVYFGDVPVPLSVLHNYFDVNAERDRLAHQAAHLAAHRAAQQRANPTGGAGRPTHEVTTVDSSSDDTSESGSDSSDSEDDTPLRKNVGRPKGTKSTTPKVGGGRRGRPPVPPELRTPGIMDMKRFCKLAGIKFDYKKLTQDCTKNKERVAKMEALLRAAGVEGKITEEKCAEVKRQKTGKTGNKAKKEGGKRSKGEKVKEEIDPDGRRVTRGQSGVRPRRPLYISSDSDDGGGGGGEDQHTPAARRTISYIRDTADGDRDSD